MSEPERKQKVRLHNTGYDSQENWCATLRIKFQSLFLLQMHMIWWGGAVYMGLWEECELKDRGSSVNDEVIRLQSARHCMYVDHII
jgi:hypothetical protein